MKRVFLTLLISLFFVSCETHEIIEPTINKDYALVINNATHDEIMIQCKHLPISIIKLQSQEKTDTLYTSSDKITIDYFGKGTYYKQRKAEITLNTNEVTSVVLSN